MKIKCPSHKRDLTKLQVKKVKIFDYYTPEFINVYINKIFMNYKIVSKNQLELIKDLIETIKNPLYFKYFINSLHFEAPFDISLPEAVDLSLATSRTIENCGK